jgi:trans-2,3-dihydro-3-hydroxyanthranilate isomerase
MRTYRYLHLDVFTETPLAGNQLAVFPEPAGLSAGEMQTIAREMAFSESTFIFPTETPGTDVRIRIFTPADELPMAGHPTIGSTFALALEGTIRAGSTEVVCGLGVGPTPVALEWKGSTLDFAWMTQQTPTFGGTVSDRSAFASAIGVRTSDLVGDQPIEVISCGLPYLLAALATRAAVDAVDVSRTAYRDCVKAAGIDDLPVFVFTLDRGSSAGDESVYSRMLAPGFGIPEDPATGSATGPLGCYLAAHDMLTPDRLQHFVSLQGAAMKRPSRLHVSIDRDGRSITRVRVGGRSVLVGRGELQLPNRA